ncbi:TerD family protein, partial [Prescottella defluvii]
MGNAMLDVVKGSKTDLGEDRYTVRLTTSGQSGLVDIAAVLLADDGKVRSDDDFVFFNNPKVAGVALTADDSVSIDLTAVPADIHRVLLTASTEAQGIRFSAVEGLAVEVQGASQRLRFTPSSLSTETVLQVVALYRRG